jgi:dTDP-4-dehydrorhamnose 3,5-epimerase
MIFTETILRGAFLIELERYEDERGFFARSYCQKEFAAHGIEPLVAQCNIASNRQRGTLRGMHWRALPNSEAKLVRVIQGAILDVIVDLRPESPTYLKHVAVELTEENQSALYVPVMFAHGFQTLTDNAVLFYQMSDFYDPTADRGARWNDPAFGIEWPIDNPILHPRDRGYADFVPSKKGG